MCLATEPAHLFGLPDLPEYAAWSDGHGLVITALVAGLPKVFNPQKKKKKEEKKRKGKERKEKKKKRKQSAFY